MPSKKEIMNLTYIIYCLQDIKKSFFTAVKKSDIVDLVSVI